MTVAPEGMDNAATHIKLKFTTGKYRFVGSINTDNNTASWSPDNKTTLVLGYEESAKELFPEREAEKFAVVINDKHAGNKNGAYSYGWYILPRTTVTSTFRSVHITKDDVLHELALYAFANNPSRMESDVAVHKIFAYDTKEIMEDLEILYPNVRLSDIKSDLTTLLVTEVMQRYPSSHLGLRSSGHGSPVGIMNMMYPEDYHMTRCFTWIKNIRGKNVDFLDFGTNCNVASLYNLQAVAPYVDYVLASDLTRMSPIPFELQGERPSDNYSPYFDNSSQSVEQILGAMLDKYQEVYNSPKAKEWAATKKAENRGKIDADWKQTLTLFRMSAFPKILNNIGGENAQSDCSKKLKDRRELYCKEDPTSSTIFADFKTAIPVIFPGYTGFLSDWNQFAIKQMDNRAAFTWDTDCFHGLILDRAW